MRSGLYRRSVRLRNVALQVLAGVHDGIWLGLLDRHDLHEIDAGHYAGTSKYQRDAYNEQGLHDWEEVMVTRHVAVGGRIIVTGAGGGREVLALRRMGYDAIGFEPHPELAREASALLTRHGHDACISVSARDAFPTTAGRADAVLVGWGSYMLISGRDTRIGFLRDARAALPEGAPVLLSFFTRPRRARYLRIVFALASSIRRVRHAEPVQFGDALLPNYAHMFDERSIAAELHEAGFTPVAYRAEPYGHAVGQVGHTSAMVSVPSTRTA